MFQPNKKPISSKHFVMVVKEENCRASLEVDRAVQPLCRTFKTDAQEFLSAQTFTAWRASAGGQTLTSTVEDRTATPLTFRELVEFRKNLPNMPDNSNLFRTNRIIANYCRECDVYVVKDGNHRLYRLAQSGENREVEVFELSSEHWRNSTLDMRNVCPCAKTKGPNQSFETDFKTQAF